MAMDKTTMRTKIKQAYFDRTGEIMSNQELVLLDVCQGIIEELLANAVTEVVIPGGSSAGTYLGVIKS